MKPTDPFYQKGNIHNLLYLSILIPSQSISMSTRRNGKFASPIQNLFIRAFFVASKLSFSRNPHPTPYPMNTRRSLAQSPHSARPPSGSLTVAPAPFQHVVLHSLEAAPIAIPLFLYLSRNHLLSIRARSSHSEVYPLGQIHHTYLLGQIDQDLFIVDQHTAHERVRFERLLRSWKKKEILQQPLLIPEPVELLPHQGELLEEWLPLLAQAGLEVERFGTTSYVVRAIPAILGNISVGPLVLELLDELSEWQSTDSLDNTIKPILATMACQSAVQAGRPMTQPEIIILLQDWAQENFPMTCPHGRRVAVRHSLEELHTIFARPLK